MLSLDEIIKHVEYVAYNNSDKSLICMGIKEYHELAELLRELQERRKADSCEGCKHVGRWENEYEYGVSCPCLRCARRAQDNYESERRTYD